MAWSIHDDMKLSRREIIACIAVPQVISEEQISANLIIDIEFIT